MSGEIVTASVAILYSCTVEQEVAFSYDMTVEQDLALLSAMAVESSLGIRYSISVQSNLVVTYVCADAITRETALLWSIQVSNNLACRYEAPIVSELVLLSSINLEGETGFPWRTQVEVRHDWVGVYSHIVGEVEVEFCAPYALLELNPVAVESGFYWSMLRDSGDRAATPEFSVYHNGMKL